MSELHNDIEEKREMNKMGLQHFSLDFENRLEQPADKLIAELKDKIDQLISKARRLERVKQEDPQRWKELQQRVSYSDIDLDEQMTEHYYDASYYEEELIAFAEMKIMYAYKHFEINVNRLLNAAFNLDQPKGFYQWEGLVTFLKSKNIVASKIACYQELKELQAVNNNIKHSDVIDQKVKPIREFAGADYVDSNRLLQF